MTEIKLMQQAKEIESLKGQLQILKYNLLQEETKNKELRKQLNLVRRELEDCIQDVEDSNR